jgi:hypothetical protein
MTQKFEITIRFEVDRDMVFGMFHQSQDWVDFITREFMRQSHYHPSFEVVDTKTIYPK